LAAKISGFQRGFFGQKKKALTSQNLFIDNASRSGFRRFSRSVPGCLFVLPHQTFKYKHYEPTYTTVLPLPSV